MAERYPGTRTPFKRTKRVAPVYPASVQDITGVVTLQVTLDLLGRVIESRAVQFIASGGSPPKDSQKHIAQLFVSSANEAVSGWQYEAPAPGSRPVTFLMSIVIRPPSSASGEAGSEELHFKSDSKTVITIPDTDAAYPPQARNQRIQGVIILETTVTSGGKVLDARVLRAIPWLDQAALDRVAMSELDLSAAVPSGERRNIVTEVWLNFLIR